jgi:hypothetical protein
MMNDCGTDFRLQADYATAHAFMMKMRKDFADVMIVFFADKEYDDAKAAGLSDEQMFRKLVEAALSFNVYPVYSDPNDLYRYKLFAMASFVELIGLRARAIVKEVERKGEMLELAFSKIPELRGLYARPQLKGDGSVIELPSAIDCTVCGAILPDQPSFVAHYNGAHSPGSSAPPAPPALGPGNPPPPSATADESHECPLCHVRLLLKESGEYKCPSCAQRYAEDGTPIHTRSPTHSVKDT